MTVKGTWKRLFSDDRLRRSSQVVTAIDNEVYIFGGELEPRKPVDDQIDVLTLSPDGPKLETKSYSPAPPPRVGSASVLLNDRVYLFSGRGGPDMAPIEEEGAVWNYDPATNQWNRIRPVDVQLPQPQARSYHCAASDGETTVFVSAGCPAEGRLNDFWKFALFERSWLELPSPPGAPRGGSSMTYLNGKVYRMNGFDGKKELGGTIDIFDIFKNAWETETFPADGKAGPEARSVASLRGITIDGKDKLITLFGERDPSSQGHAGAGKMLGDVWVYDIAEKKWTEVEAGGPDGVPAPRGWFDADLVKQNGKDCIVVHGGLSETNERLGDVWLLSF